MLFTLFLQSFCNRFGTGTLSSCRRILQTARFAVRTNCSKTPRSCGDVRTHIVRSCSIALGGSALITGTVYARLNWNSPVFCRANHWTRTVEPECISFDEEYKFPWKEFLKLLLPDIWYLIGAILVSYSLSFTVFFLQSF